MMHVKIYKDVIRCREVIALWLPKYQWISGDAHEYSLEQELLPKFHNFDVGYQFAIEFACLAFLYLPERAFN